MLPLIVYLYYFVGDGWGACPGEAFRTLPDGTDQLIRPELCVYGMTGTEVAAIVLPLIAASIASVVYLARQRDSALVSKEKCQRH